MRCRLAESVRRGQAVSAGCARLARGVPGVPRSTNQNSMLTTMLVVYPGFFRHDKIIARFLAKGQPQKRTPKSKVESFMRNKTKAHTF